MANNFDTTVSFNVGGKVYEVSRSLLKSFPETLLAKKATQQATSGGGNPIFIDRDADRFAYCLDYMRDGKVHLPGTISKGSFLQELTYFGFEKVSIDQTDATTMAAQFMLRHALSARREIEDLDKKKRMKQLAHLIFCRIQTMMWKGGYEPKRTCFLSAKDEEVRKMRPIDDDSLNEYLAAYGLRGKTNDYYDTFNVDLLCIQNDTVQK
jgi:hypothetical protein